MPTSKTPSPTDKKIKNYFFYLDHGSPVYGVIIVILTLLSFQLPKELASNDVLELALSLVFVCIGAVVVLNEMVRSRTYRRLEELLVRDGVLTLYGDECLRADELALQTLSNWKEGVV